MAMSKCKECDKEVSSKIKSCPHCGIKNSGVTGKKTAKGLLILCGLSVAFATSAALGDIKLTNSIFSSETTLASKTATTFYFGGDQQNYCSATVTHDLFKSSMGKFSNVRRNQPEFDMSCDWDGKYYVLSNKNDTFANVSFHGKEGVANTLFANIDAKLITSKGDSISISGNEIEVKLN